jgi:predicted amidohydrolase
LLPGTKIALLICGEALSDKLRQRVASAKCHALFIPAHFNVILRQDHLGRGKGSWHHPLKVFQRENDIPVILSEHTGSPNRHAYSWPAGLSRVCKIKDFPAGLTLRAATV